MYHRGLDHRHLGGVLRNSVPVHRQSRLTIEQGNGWVWRANCDSLSENNDLGRRVVDGRSEKKGEGETTNMS